MTVNEMVAEEADSKSQSDMQIPENLIAPISKSMRVRVVPRMQGQDHQSVVHAINWFDTRSLLLYNIYNALAARSVRRINGLPIFKGRLYETLSGSSENGRETLLLVRYPDAQHFTKMVANREFQLTSVLREAAVKRFTFGLSTAPTVELSEWGSEQEGSFLVHHWKGKLQTREMVLAKVVTAAKTCGASVVFRASITYTLQMKKDRKDLVTVPCLMDHFAMLHHADENILRSCFGSTEYQEALAASDSSFVGLMHRLS